MGFTSRLLREKWETPVFTGHGATLQNVRDFNVNVNAFEFEAMLRNTSTPEECVCRRAIVYLLTSEMAIIVPLSTKGCSSELSLLTTNGWKLGKENDLSGFGCDFNSFQHLECQVKDRRLKILLHNKLILDTSEQQTIGAIIGIRIGFEGAGEIRDIRLDSHGMPIYQESF